MFPIIRNLFAATPARATQPTRLGRLGCESLEARDCPAIISTSYNLPGGGWNLIISANGANTADQVVIRENHDTNVLQVLHNNAAGQVVTTTFNNTAGNGGLRQVNVSLGAGDDSFRYELNGSDYTDGKVIRVDLGNAGTYGDSARIYLNNNNPFTYVPQLASVRSTTADFQFIGGTGTQSVLMYVGDINGTAGLARLNVTANLGDGNDSFLSNHYGDQLGTTQVNLSVFGEGGNDTLRVLATNDVDIDQYGLLSVQLDGGVGNDYLEARYAGELDGNLNLNVRGRDGNDTIRASAQKQSGSTGYIQGFIYGDAGTDDVTYTGPLDGLTVSS